MTRLHTPMSGSEANRAKPARDGGSLAVATGWIHILVMPLVVLGFSGLYDASYGELSDSGLLLSACIIAALHLVPAVVLIRNGKILRTDAGVTSSRLTAAANRIKWAAIAIIATEIWIGAPKRLIERSACLYHGSVTPASSAVMITWSRLDLNQ